MWDVHNQLNFLPEFRARRMNWNTKIAEIPHAAKIFGEDEIMNIACAWNAWRKKRIAIR